MIATTPEVFVATRDDLTTQLAIQGSTADQGDYYWDEDSFAQADKIYTLGLTIDLYFKPLSFVTSVIGNMLCIVVLAGKHYKMVALRNLLMIIAGLDIFIILLNMRFYLSSHILDDDSPLMVLLKPQSTLYCGFELFFFYFTTQLSAWTIVLLTLERFLVTWFPLRAPLWCTARRMMQSWALVALLLLLANCPLFFLVEHKPSENFVTCQFKDADQFSSMWDWMDLSIMCLVPFALISVFNVLIVFKVYRQVRASKMMTGSSGISGDKVRSLTLMLVSVSLAYLLTTTPAAIYNIALSRMLPDTSTNKLSSAKAFLIFTILENIYLLNHVGNFFFYFTFGAKFREACRDTLLAHLPCRQALPKSSSTRQTKIALPRMTKGSSSGVATVSSTLDSQQKNQA